MDLDCSLPGWLADEAAWAEAVEEERAVYDRFLGALGGLSDAREKSKAALLARLTGEHQLVLAFERFMITLDVLHGSGASSRARRLTMAT